MKVIVSILMISLLNFACASHRVVPVTSTVPAGTDTAKVSSAITKGALELGWVAKNLGPGKMELVLNVRTHTVVVEVDYSKTEYTINYKSSVDMKYNPSKGTIHNKYGKWVSRLRQSIDLQLVK